MHRAFPLLAALVMLASCGRPAGSSDAASVTPVSPEPTATPPASASSPIGSAPPSSVAGAAIGDYLPVKLDGVELHTFAVAQDVTARLGQAVGAPLELAYASEHGARFIQTIAIRAPGTDASALAMLFPAAAFPPDGATADVSEADLGGEGVTAVADPAATARLGTYYLLARDDVLIVVETFTPEDAADMIGALPSP